MKQEATYIAHFYRRQAGDQRFFAYFLNRKVVLDQSSPAQLAGEMEGDLPAFYRLAACGVPATGNPDYDQQLQEIADYCGLPASGIRQLLKEIRFMDRLRDTVDDETQFSPLMAARDKDESE